MSYSRLSDKFQIAVVEKFGYGFSDVVDKGRDIDSILEALYWPQKYPDEVTAIIGLDMAVPEYYDSMNINIPAISDSDAVKYGTLSDDEKEIWRKIPIEYISQIKEGEYIELNCPHYVHDYEYIAISESIIAFLSKR